MARREFQELNHEFTIKPLNEPMGGSTGPIVCQCLPKHHSLNLFAWRRCATSEVTLVESSRPDDRGGQRQFRPTKKMGSVRMLLLVKESFVPDAIPAHAHARRVVPAIWFDPLTVHYNSCGPRGREACRCPGDGSRRRSVGCFGRIWVHDRSVPGA